MMQTFIDKENDQVIFKMDDAYLVADTQHEDGPETLQALAIGCFVKQLLVPTIDTSIEEAERLAGAKDKWVEVDSLATYLEGSTS